MERVSSFLAMDVLSAAAAKERRGDSVIHMEVGQPSAPAPRAAREAAKAALDLGPHRLHGGAWPSAAAGAHRTPLSRQLRRERGARAGHRDDRFVGGLRPGLSQPLRSRPAHRHHGAGLSGLSQHPGGARSRAGRDPARRGRWLDHDRRGRRHGACGKAAPRHSRHEPRQSLRNDDRPGRPCRTRCTCAAVSDSGSSRTRSITA